jgi:death on curing protein
VIAEPIWLLRESVLAMHYRQLAEHGGSEGIRDSSSLESALQRPREKHAYGEPDLCALAAAYAYGIARNHPFVDGNKLTALVASFTFIELNGLRLTSSQAENLAAFLALAAGELKEEALAAWLRKHAKQV